MSKLEGKKGKIVDWIVCGVLVVIAIGCVTCFFYYNWSVKRGEDEFEKLRSIENTENMVQEQVTNTETETDMDTEMVLETETETEAEDYVYCESVYDFEELHQQNEDIYAWIIVPGTQVDYPVLQSEVDNYYLDYNVDHSKGYPGCIYSNQCNAKDFSDYITVLYGHNMKKGTMFGSLHSFEDESFFEENRKIYVYTEERRLTYDIYAAVKFSDVYITYEYNIASAIGSTEFLEDVESYMDNSVSHTYEEIERTDEDKLLVLSTCVNGERERRYLIVGTLTEVAYYE